MRHFAGALLSIALLGGHSAVAVQLRPSPSSIDVPAGPCGPNELHQKDLDVVIYGASGFVGKQAAQYLMEGQVDLPLWAIAGRSSATLEPVQEMLRANGTKAQAIVAQMNDTLSLQAMATRARAIVNFAGPFEWHGSEQLILAALAGCAHYVDISTEVGWNRQMMTSYGELAAQRGVAIVQSAGTAATVADFLAMSAIREVNQAQGYPPKEVMVLWTKFNDGLSHGQLHTAFAQTAKHDVSQFDPYALAPGQLYRVDLSVDGFTGYGVDKVMGALAPSVIAKFDCPVIRRSTFLAYPNASISIREAATDQMGKDRDAFLRQAVGLATREYWQNQPPSKDSFDGAFPEGEEAVAQEDLSAPEALLGGGAPAAMPADDMPATGVPAMATEFPAMPDIGALLGGGAPAAMPADDTPATDVPAMAPEFPAMPDTGVPANAAAEAPAMPFFPTGHFPEPLSALQVGSRQVPSIEQVGAFFPADNEQFAQQPVVPALAQEPPMLEVEPPAKKQFPFMVPPASKGPSDWVLTHGSFSATAIAKSPFSLVSGPGVEGRVTMQGSGDPYFRGSARIATEVALGLALHGTFSRTGGYLTPSTALGTEQLERRLKLVEEGSFAKFTHYHFKKTIGMQP